MKPIVTVIDYGLGNIFSIANALSYCGSEMLFTSSANEVVNAKGIILPGVGAFKDGMNGLRKKGLINALKEFAQSDRPFLGICLGMQMMLDVSEEFGEHEGLGMISGRIVPIPKTSEDGLPHKIPHIGWNCIEKLKGGRSWEETILKNISPKTEFYFIHSFTAVPHNEEYRLADTFYNGIKLSAVIAKGNLYGCQFHPEKSGEAGLKIIRNFIKEI